MKEHLQRFLLLTVLLSLGVNGHVPQATFIGSGIWQASEQPEMALPCEEEVESESETHFDLLNSDGSDDGGGGDDEIGLTTYFDDEGTTSRIPFLFDFPFLQPYFGLLPISKVQTEANLQELLTESKPHLFLLYHNIKTHLSDTVA